MKSILTIVAVVALCRLSAQGMGRLDALSQIESQNNDYAIGPQGEVSRYQILPEFWSQAMKRGVNVVFRPTDEAVAQVVVNWIMQERCRGFEAHFHRAPNDFEYYILWHRPALMSGSARRHLTRAEIDRGRRFASLCQTQ